MKPSVSLICVPLLSICVSATAQESAASGSNDKKDAATAAASAGAKPPAQMSLLDPRIGTWRVTIRTQPGKSLPAGGIDQGVMTIRKGPGGFSIVQDFWSRGSGGHTIGQSYTWWDGGANTYKSVWCDNMQGCTEFTTAIAGNSWTTELDGEDNGQKVHTTIRATMSPDHNSIHEEFMNSYGGGPARTETISEYRRVATGATQAK